MRNYLPRPADCNFDERAAERAVRFINEFCRHTKGRWSGQPFRLRPWQEYHIREIFGRVDAEGNRVIRQVYWEIPKKSGKSETAAAIALKLLFADDEPGAEVYGAAADRDQASIVYSVAMSMVKREPRLYRRSKIIDSIKRIVLHEEESFYRALSSDVAGKHGYNSHGVIFDEVHAQRTMELWEVLTFGAGDARLQPLVFAITTAGVPGESPVAEMLHDDAEQMLNGVVPCPPDFYPVIYSAPAEAPWDNEETWRMCNPALGDFLRIESVQEACERAKRRPSEQNSFRRLRLNQWVAQETRFIALADWDACGGTLDIAALRGMPCYAALDLSTTTDISALVLDFFNAEAGIHHAVPFFWLPEENVPDNRKQWVRQGLINTTSGNVLDYEAIRRRVNELGKDWNILEIAYDPWNATQLSQQLMGDGFRMIPVRQGYQSLSAPTKELERIVLDRRIRHGGNPVLRWMADCLAVAQDPAGNIKPVKPDRRRSTKRIDGMVALIMAIDRATRSETAPSVYEQRGLLTI